MARLKTKLQSFVFLYVVAPMLVVLLYFLINLYQRKIEAYQAGLVTFRDGVGRTLSLEINQTERSVSSFAALPQVAKVLGGALAARQRLTTSQLTVSDFFKMIETGQGIVSNRTIGVSPQQMVNNPATERFLVLQEEHPEMVDFVLTDNLGDTLAASNPDAERNFVTDPWWRTAFTDRRAAVFYEPKVDDDGRFGMFSAIWDNSSGELLPLGALRVTIDLDALMDRIGQQAMPTNLAVMTMNPSKWMHVAGDPWLVSETAKAIFGEINTRFMRTGWFAGTHFSSIALDERFRINNEDQMLLVALRRDPLTPSHILHELALAVVLSLVALGVISGLAWLAALRLVNTNEAMVDAGIWLLHRVRGEEKVPQAQVAHVEKSPLGREIHSWEMAFRRSIAQDVEAHTFESRRDLELAHDFQMAYLNRPYPKVPSVPVPGRLSLRFHHRYKPALALGGDFFDLAPLSQESAGLFIADVMGHGTRSALITSILRTLLTDHKAQGRNARNFMRELNRSFCGLIKQVRMDYPLFASAYYFVADTTARAATFCTAGHPAPFHIRGATNTIERLRVAEPHGAALGIHPDEEYSGGSCRLIPGDIFIFFTDGAYECFNPKGEEFGMAGIEAALRRLMHQGVANIVNGLMDVIDDFTAASTLRDDVCIVGIEVQEESSAVEKGRTGRIQLPENLPGA